MKAIETTAVIGNDRKLSVQLPPDVTPGQHHVVLVIEELLPAATTSLNDFPTIDLGPWPVGLSLSREDMYGDDGR